MKKFIIFPIAFLMMCCTPLADESTFALKGYVQKGQFVKGSQITAYGLNKNLEATGNSWPSNIKDVSGSFVINAVKDAAYLELRADGYYFNEVTGGTSDAPMTLEAIVDPKTANVNINLLTHLVRPRIKQLIKTGSSYAEARSQAERELIQTLGYSAIDISFDQLDITKAREGDALLLALSCALQQDRKTGELVTLINDMSLFFEENGKLSDVHLNAIKEGLEKVDIVSVYDKIETYYASHSLSEAKIPEFYKYTLKEDDLIVTQILSPALGHPYEGEEGSIDVISLDFEVESDCTWIIVSKEKTWGPCHKVKYVIEPNESMDNRTGKIILKGKQGNIKHEIEIMQSGKYELVYFSVANDNKLDYLYLNGVKYESLFQGTYSVVVKVYPSEFYIASYPDIVEKQNDGTYLVTMPSESDGRVAHIGTKGAEMESGYLKAFPYVKLHMSNYPEWSRIEVSSPEGVDICGDAILSDDMDWNLISVKNGKSTIGITRSSDNAELALSPMLPCTTKLRIVIYSSDNVVLFDRTTAGELTFQFDDWHSIQMSR